MSKKESVLLDSYNADDLEEIRDFILGTSSDMYEYMIEHPKQRYVLFYKYITHSDLPTFGKATAQDSFDDNILYYLTPREMRDIEIKTHKPFQTAKQSNIGLSKELYNIMHIPNPRDVDPYRLNEYMDVFLVNDTAQYFNYQNSWAVFNKLNKDAKINGDSEWSPKAMNALLNRDGPFTRINIHIARHGIGTTDDVEFRKLRHNIFKGDTIALLYEQNYAEGTKRLYILVKKNPLFFTLTNKSNESYDNYQKRFIEASTTETIKSGDVDKLLNGNLEKTFEEGIRRQQTSWRRMLAEEMMAYSGEPNFVFCPFTFLSADFDKLGQLFVASHIKAVKDPNTTEKERYDINNGLLLSLSADALFDKHLITVNQNKKLIFSKVFEGHDDLKAELLLDHDIFEPVLNSKRMEYLAYHEKIFWELEKDR